jgi:hypothetical protein
MLISNWLKPKLLDLIVATKVRSGSAYLTSDNCTPEKLE